MRIAYFPNYVAQNGSTVLSAFLDGCNLRGISTVEGSLDADAAVIWSVLWHGRMTKNQDIYQHYQQQQKPVIVIDVGTLYRGSTWKIAVNNITAQGYYGHTENLDWDRPRKLGISLALNFSANPKIIIAAQHACSLQVKSLVSVEHWIMQQVEQLRTVTDRPIVVRPHPRCSLDRTKLPTDLVIEQPQKIANSYDSYNLAFDCHAMVNYNSGPGIQAAMAGTRPMVDSSSLAYPVSITLADIDRPYTTDRDQWLVEICHTEYTVDEIAQGHWAKRLAPALDQ
jgi:hypothetical protein